MKKLSTKVLIGFITVGFFPMFIIASIALVSAENSLLEKSYQKLDAVKDIKKNSIKSYFEGIEKQILTLAINQNVVNSLEGFSQHFYNYGKNALDIEKTPLNAQESSVKQYWQKQFGGKYLKETGRTFDMSQFKLSEQAIKLQYDFISHNSHPLGQKNNLNGLENKDYEGYNHFHKAIHPWLNTYLQRFGFYDIFLIDNQGAVVYSVFKELDYATSLERGPWKQTGLAQAYKKAKALKHGQVYFTDLSLYPPSYDAPAGFISTPIFKNHNASNANNSDAPERLGTLIFQIPLDQISAVMNSNAGIGTTGETYLVGQDKLMRSDSIQAPQTHSVINSFRYPETGKMDTLAVEKVLNQEAGELITDKLGNEVLSAYTPIQIGSQKWGLVAEMNTSEAFASITSLKVTIVILSIIMMLIIIAMALVFSRKITKPIVQLVNKMSVIRTSFNFAERVEVETKDEVGQAALAFNQMLESTQHALNQVNATMEDISNGQFKSRINIDLSGDLKSLKDNVNNSANSVENTMTALNNIMQSLADGDFDARLDNSIKGELSQQVNNTMESMKEAIVDFKSVMKRLSQGDLHARITTELKGELNDLKIDTNHSLEQIQTAIEAISKALQAQSQGDLTAKVNNEMLGELDTLKQSINNSNASLNSVITTVINGAHNVDIASHQVSSGSDDLSNRTQQQAAAIEETTAAMEQLTATIKQNADNALNADQLAQQARNQAQSGRDIMNETEAAILQIHESSKQIEEITSLIDGIAFQTNLLALNAAVEAARAGEHGRGFAVVAGEVRSLAGKSAEAAKEIKELITNTVTSIENGTQKIEQTSGSLTEINESINQVSHIVAEISSASQEQQQGINQINSSISNIDQTTQQNAALAQETSASSSSMTTESERLKTVISTFKTQ